MTWVTVRDAAVALGIGEGAVRKRIARGRTVAVKREDGLLYVDVDLEGQGARLTRDAGARRVTADGDLAGLQAAVARLTDLLEEEGRRRDAAWSVVARLSEEVLALKVGGGVKQSASLLPPGDGRPPVSRPWWRRFWPRA